MGTETVMLLTTLLGGLLGGVGSARAKPAITQEYILKNLPLWQAQMRASAYAGLPMATQAVSEMAAKGGLTNESQAGIRYGEIANLAAQAEMEAAKMPVAAMQIASQFPSNTDWFTRFLMGFMPGTIIGGDWANIIYKIMKLLKNKPDLMLGIMPKVETDSAGKPGKEAPDYYPFPMPRGYEFNPETGTGGYS